MATNGEARPASAEAEAGLYSRAAGSSPVAVVWCRQVDNEAESPGYTTVPEEFPGHRETLDIIRIVGNLTVNIADTHDYWDPDPTQPLSYYPNLFLYPAYGGRYTCVGRMFLSTEDRPRLGMKTLVLDTQQLLATGEFGSNVLRWHASMGGARRDGGRPPPVPDPNIYGVLGEGLLFHKGSTDPLVIVAASEWEPAMQALLEMIRALPASLIALGAILVFPYFLPQPKTNLHEFTEQIPLALAMMRVGKGEAGTERHAKRIVSWEGSAVAVRDITDGVPSPPSRGKESLPLVVQFIRDHNEAKLTPIVQRVDMVEMPRLTRHLTDSERQGGRDRRKEMWRIATAMESAALLLQKSRGRHVPVSQETAKRAQEYLQARVSAESLDRSEEVAVAPTPAPLASTAAPRTPAPVPPWLQKPPETIVPGTSPDHVEPVPVSTSDDPSMLKAPDPPAPAPPSSSPAARRSTGSELPTPVPSTRPPEMAPKARPGAVPPPPNVPFPPAATVPPVTPVQAVASIDLSGLRREIEQSLTRYIDERLAQVAANEARRSAQETQSALHGEITRLSTAQAESTRDEIDRRLNSLRTDLLADLKRQLGELQTRLSEALPTSVTVEVEKKLGPALDPKIAAATGQAVKSMRTESREVADELRNEVTKTLKEMRSQITAAEEELREGLSAQLDLHLREAQDREAGVRETMEARLKETVGQRFQEGDVRRQREAREMEQKLGLLVDGRFREIQEKLNGSFTGQEARLARTLEEGLRTAEERLFHAVDQRANELQTGQVSSVAELQVRMQSYADQKLREGLDREREKYIELLARLRSEVEGAIVRSTESARVDAQLREKLSHSIENLPQETRRLATEAVTSMESKIRAEQGDQIRRLDEFENDLKDREQEIILLEQGVRSDLEDIERRTTILSERVVPIVRKTWLRIAELEKRNPESSDVEYRVNQVRRDVTRDIRRLESLISGQVQEMRDRVETSITNQGKVWLTLVQQLSSVSEGRRATGGPLPVPRPTRREPEEPVEEPGESTSIDDWLAPASRSSRPSSSREEASNASDDDTDEDDEDGARPARRRGRRSSGR